MQPLPHHGIIGYDELAQTIVDEIDLSPGSTTRSFSDRAHTVTTLLDAYRAHGEYVLMNRGS